MDITQMIQDALTSMMATYSTKGIEITHDTIKSWLEKIKANSKLVDKEIEDVKELAEIIVTQQSKAPSKVGFNFSNSSELARYLEIPEQSLKRLSIDANNTSILIQHVILEHKFAKYLEEWGYQVEYGKVLSPKGEDDLEWLVDVYGKLHTLHGIYEVAINFACDDPPDEDRVIAKIGNAKTYGKSRGHFSNNDVYIIVTPYEFTQGASAAIRIHNKESEFAILGLEAREVFDIDTKDSPFERLLELQDRVKKAFDENLCYHGRNS